MDLRKLARGKPCMVRRAECRCHPDETVLAHLNGAGWGLKNPDLLACWAGYECHQWLDGGYANEGYTRAERDAVHHAAIIRTQQELLKMGLAEVIEEWRNGDV